MGAEGSGNLGSLGQSQPQTHTQRRRSRRRIQEHGSPPRGGPGRCSAVRREESPGPGSRGGMGWDRMGWGSSTSPLRSAPQAQRQLLLWRWRALPHARVWPGYFSAKGGPEPFGTEPGGHWGGLAVIWAGLGALWWTFPPPALGTGCWVGTANERGFSNKQRRPC